MRIGVAVNASPLALGPPPPDDELQSHHKRRQDRYRHQHDDRPAPPERVAEPPHKDQRGSPEPRVPGMGEEHCKVSQDARLLGNAQLFREARVESKYGLNLHRVRSEFELPSARAAPSL